VLILPNFLSCSVLAQMTDLVEDTCPSLRCGLTNTVSVSYFPIKRADMRTY